MNELTTADPRSIHAHIKAHSDAIFRIKLFYYSVNFFLVQLFRGILLKKRGSGWNHAISTRVPVLSKFKLSWPRNC